MISDIIFLGIFFGFFGKTIISADFYDRNYCIDYILYLGYRSYIDTTNELYVNVLLGLGLGLGSGLQPPELVLLIVHTCGLGTISYDPRGIVYRIHLDLCDNCLMSLQNKIRRSKRTVVAVEI